MATKKKETENENENQVQTWKPSYLTATDAAIRCTGTGVAKGALYTVGAPLEIIGATIADAGSAMELAGSVCKKTAAKLSFRKSIEKAAAGQMQRTVNSDARRAKQADAKAAKKAAKQAKQAAKQSDDLGLVEPELA